MLYGACIWDILFSIMARSCFANVILRPYLHAVLCSAKEKVMHWIYNRVPNWVEVGKIY